MKSLFNSKFNLITVLSLIAIFLLIVVFMILGGSIAPHIRFQTLEGNQESAEIVNQKLKLYFSTPMEKTNTEKYIHIEPSVKFTAAWSSNVLFIIFKENLQYASNYKVTLSKSIKDIYSQNLVEDFIYSFKTKNPQIAYIEKSFENKKDKIVVNDPQLNNPQTLAEYDDIKLFNLNSNFLVVVSNENKVSELKVKNLKNNEVKILDYPDKLIDRIDLSPIRNEIIFLTQEVLRKSDYVIPQQEMAVNIVNLDTWETKKIQNSTILQGVIDVKYSPDGSSFVYKTSDSYYYVAQISDPDKNTLIGRYLSDGGFNTGGDKIIFVNFDPLSTYSQAQFLLELNVDRTTKNLTTGDIPVLDPQYFNLNDTLVFAEKNKELDRTKGLFKIVKLDRDGVKSDVIVDEDESLELPRVSYDDRYIAVEKYSKSDLLNFQNQRNLGFQTKPSIATLVIFDSLENKLIDNNISAINAVWIR